VSRRFCCCGECSVFSDSFNRTPSTDLGSGWSELSGDWEIVDVGGDGRLRENGNSGALILTTATSRTKEQYVTAGLFIDTGDIFRIFVNAVDANNYHMVQIEQNALDTTLKFFRNASLLREETIDLLENETQVDICINSVSFTVSFSPTPTGEFFYVCNPNLISNGNKAGLGNGGSNVLEFSGFVLSNFIGIDGSEPDDKHCCTQQCLCIENEKEYCIPQTLTATITAFGGCHPDGGGQLDGVTFDLDYESSEGTWDSDFTSPACFASWKWVFACGASDCSLSLDVGKFFTLTNLVNAGGCTGDPDSCMPYDESDSFFTCDPLVITFPSHDYPGFDPDPVCLCCNGEKAGSFYIVITD
jgi:hypothetical protein